MTSNPLPLRTAGNVACPVAGHFGFLAEARPACVHEGSVGNCLCGGFTCDFATADRERVMVAALTRRQFADLAQTTRRAGTFAFLERLVDADFSACGDLYTHRAAIALLLAPWFARRTVADVAAAFAGTSVSWAWLHDLTSRPGPGSEPLDGNHWSGP
jgi:2-methylfumaryl-CoA isomerase